MFDTALQVALTIHRYSTQANRALPGGIAVHIYSRLLIPILVVVMTISWAVAATAQPKGMAHRTAHHRAEHGTTHVDKPDASARNREEGRHVDRDRDRPLHRRERSRRACRHKSRRGIPGGCYIVNDEWVEDYNPDDALPAAQQKSGDTISLAPITPVPTQSGLHVIPTSGNKPLKEELIAARRNWLEKKRQLEDASAARARAEYQVRQNGGEVDPALIASQDQAQSEATDAQAAIGSLVKRARKAGFSSETLDLYERANRGY